MTVDKTEHRFTSYYNSIIHKLDWTVRTQIDIEAGAWDTILLVYNLSKTEIECGQDIH